MGVENPVALSAEQAAEHCAVFRSVNATKLQVPVLNHHGRALQDITQLDCRVQSK